MGYLINGLTNRHKNLYDTKPHITEHTSKFHLDRFSFTPVRVRQIAQKVTARQMDRQTYTEAAGSKGPTPSPAPLQELLCH